MSSYGAAPATVRLRTGHGNGPYVVNEEWVQDQDLFSVFILHIIYFHAKALMRPQFRSTRSSGSTPAWAIGG